MAVIAARAQARSLPRRVVRALGRDKSLYLMCMPPLAYFLVFCYGPMYGVLLAFKDFDVGKGIRGSPWVGFKYFEVFFSNPYSFKLIRNTLLLRLWQLALGFPTPIVLALLLNEIRSNRFKRLVQTSSCLPHFISRVVVGVFEQHRLMSPSADDLLVEQSVKYAVDDPHPGRIPVRPEALCQRHHDRGDQRLDSSRRIGGEKGSTWGSASRSRETIAWIGPVRTGSVAQIDWRVRHLSAIRGNVLKQPRLEDMP